MTSDKHTCEGGCSSTNRFIRSIGADNFVREVLEEGGPVLVLCMHRDDEFQEQITTIEGICGGYGERLKVCLVEEEFIGVFKKRFDVQGTPTFMIFIRGAEEGRRLGLVEEKTFKDFVSRVLSFHRGGKKFGEGFEAAF